MELTGTGQEIAAPDRNASNDDTLEAIETAADIIAEAVMASDGLTPDELATPFDVHVRDVCELETDGKLDGPTLDLLTEMVLQRVGNGWRQ